MDMVVWLLSSMPVFLFHKAQFTTIKLPYNGGMAAALQNSILKFETIMLDKNKADIDGGSVYMNGSSAIISSSQFQVAQQKGWVEL